jgi:hypothetical protein
MTFLYEKLLTAPQRARARALETSPSHRSAAQASAERIEAVGY